MISTTDTGPRQSPARRSKIVAGTLSAGALVAIVTGLAGPTHDGPVAPTSTGNAAGSTPTATFPPARLATPAAVPAPAPARGAPAAPHAVSKASGG
ncbi:hypothetical protein ORI20_26770 [Mycobacterium sp. CVI_P3]|uniref:Alanine and proline-rich secreted protein Apa n=1 Tax=Mycobacterium pinniadriaticum TaxID=2994102 RepID=A0ABT3SN99_9MYCO|nr:hypothetical protein [Mycobacterium pinniadriaticum]MCX2933880.1 hypothetical protein [Mycobacterium pinniadriaticum]MCX2940267.1 hypothetical protein [Mycobacterium pinniadriaticum]